MLAEGGGCSVKFTCEATLGVLLARLALFPTNVLQTVLGGTVVVCVSGALRGI